ADCLQLLALGAIPLLVLELVKVVRNNQRQRKTAPDEYINWFDKTTGRISAILRLAVNKFSDIDGSHSAGAFAHFAFFSLFPLIVIFVTIASVFIDRNLAETEVIAFVETYVPISGEMQSYIFDTISGVVKARGQASAIAFIMLVWSAMQFFTTLISATNRAWGAEAYNWWRLPLKSLIFLTLMIFAVMLAVGVPLITKMTKDWLFPVNDFRSWVYALWRFFVPLLVVFLSLTLFYKLAPRRSTRFSEVWAAAFFATALLQAVASLFVVYLTNFATLNAVYGAFGGIMALLLWIYLCGCIFIFGACLCASQAEIRSLQVETADAVYENSMNNS
ncbi:MAG: YihY/virulence factor BrkB family protein, partial [Desulfosalsimonadaceae bacterium]|nr:YihY/virulence factor BrkB family protein [Desulfosalsimonadaceae bacterium]